MTKHDLAVSSASLPRSWQAFALKPDAANAKAVAGELEKMRTTAAAASMKLIAATLAERTPQERSTMSRLIVSELMGDNARDFLKATAATRLKHPMVVPPKDPTAQHDNPVHYLDLVKPKNIAKSRNQKLLDTKLHDAQLLDALDLHTADRRSVNLAALLQRVENEADASSMGHLKMAVDLVDSINGGKVTYSQARRTEMEDVVKGTTQEHLVDQLGFRAARTQRTEKTGLSAQNELATTYWRSTFHKTLPEFVKRLRTKVKPEQGDLLVNSPRVLRKIEMLVGKKVADQLTVEPLAGRSGVSVLKGTQALNEEWDSILHEIGAAPSAYQLYELMDIGKNEPETNFKVDARADLVELMTSSRFSRLQEIARSTGQLATVCAMVEHLVLGLTDELGPQRFDTLTASALGSMSRLLDIIVENEADPSAAMRAVDLLLDEIGIVVAAAKNYTVVDYRETMQKIMLERAPSLEPLVGKEINLDSHLMSSGMDSLGTALHIALAARDHDQVSRPTGNIDYFETGMLLDRLKKGQTVAPRSDVMVAALNPSSPFVAPSQETLVSDVRSALKTRKKGDPPFALILDTTIQMATGSDKDPTQLNVVLDGLKDLIADGSLEVFLCKSFQKYASFGTGKVAAGDLTMVSKKGNLDSAWSRAEALLQDHALDLASHDEGQMVIHMLRHGHRDELALIGHAAENAKLVDEFCWPIDRSDLAKGSSYVDGIPLLLRSTPTGNIDALFKNLTTVDWRDSFSFLRTSYVGGIPGPFPVPTKEKHYVRINTGHEQKEAMVENFYAFGHLASSLPPGAKSETTPPVVLSSLTAKAVNDHLLALKSIADTDDPAIKQYRNNIIASYCAFGLQNAKPKSTMASAAVDFFADSTAGVTIDTQRFIARELLALTQPNPVPSNPRVLAALCNAAIVLPDWQFKPFAKALKIGSIGTSKEADLLRDIITRATQD